MAVLTYVRVSDAAGSHLATVANFGTPNDEDQATAALDYVLNCSPGSIGVLEMTVPLSVNPALFQPDTRIGVWRSIDGGAPYLDSGAIYLCRYFDYGPTSTFVRAYHATSILDRRMIAYAAGTTYTAKAATFADDQIKVFVNQQMGAGIVGADRDGVETYADISSYVTIQANLSQGANIAKTATRRKLLDVCTEIAQASQIAGTYVTFEIVAPTESTLELRTYAGQRGVDRSVGTTNPVILSPLRGNLTNAHLSIDYTDVASFVIAGGTGEGTARLIGTSFDSALAGNSPFGRIEYFRDGSNVSTQAAVDDEADAGLRAMRPVIIFTGNLIETPSTTRGIDFDLGDIITAEHPQSSLQFDCRIDMIHERITASGRDVTCGLRSVT
jgi:hypothetical protein